MMCQLNMILNFFFNLKNPLNENDASISGLNLTPHLVNSLITFKSIPFYEILCHFYGEPWP
jgi:hypothetical protein